MRSPEVSPVAASAEELERLRSESEEYVRITESEIRFRTMADTAPVFIWTSDLDNHCDWFNAGWLAFTGRTLAQEVGDGWHSGIHPDDLDRVLSADHRAFQTRTPFNVEYRLRRHDGEYHWVLDTGIPRYDPDGNFAGYIGTSLDIHDRRVAEERARQTTKMEAIGRLAGGLAHDLNNQLQAVIGFTAFLEREPGLGAQGRKDLAEIDKAADRMRSLVSQLLAFSRQQVLSPETLDLNAAVIDAQALLQRLIGPTIDLQLELEAGRKWTRVDRTQFLQVLMNLTINARDAMPQGGKVVFRTRGADIQREGPDHTGSTIATGRYVELEVTDTGSGIPEEHLNRIFEPFFTTKPVGKGTGLGLATVHGIVAQSHGHLLVQTRAGQGTTFTVLLPAAEGPEETDAGSPLNGGETRPGGCVLVVEDEDVVRRVIVRTLEEAGFQTLQARHGLEALDILNREYSSITIVLTDLIMPVLNGIELTRRIAEIGMQLPVVWMSGHPLEAIPEAQSGAEAIPFMAKPINPTQLVELLARLTAAHS
jgi:PAS domain S-box-containing protein